MAVGIPLDEDKTKAVLRQVEFYFSDSNLPRDNFLRKTVQDSEDGLVSLALICSFSRMRTHLDLGTTGADEIPEEMVQAVAVVLRNSSSLTVSEDGKTIGRNSKLLKPEEVLEQVDSRTIAASPLPYDVQIEGLESFFGQHGKVNSVRLPRHVADKRHFCGTALIEFSNEEEAENLLKECLVYAGADLEIKPKKDFDAEVEGMKGDFEKPRSNKNASNGSYPKGLIISFKLKSIQTDEATEQTDASEAEVPNSTGSVKEDEEKTSETDNKDDKSFESVENNNVEKAAEDEQDTELKFNNNASEEGNAEITKSSTGERTGKDENVVTREDLKRIFQKFGTVKYIDYQMGGESGYIRFEDPEAAVEARAVAVLGDQGGLVVKNFIAILEALTGDAEKEYWSALRGFQDSRRGRGGRNSRGGRHFDGKRSGRRFDSADGRSNKAQKISSD